MSSNNTAENKKRNSSIELFRIIATFLVLIVHFTNWFVGGMFDITDSSIPREQIWGQIISSSISICCVNCFLVISGWFGLKLKTASIYKLWTMLVFIYVPCCFLRFYQGDVNLFALANSIIAFTADSYFIQNYVMLLFLSPILNSFIEKYGDRIKFYVICFLLIGFIFSNVLPNESLLINRGYSLFHFVLMYLLGRLAYIYKECIFKIKRPIYLLIYFTSVTIIALQHLFHYPFTWEYSNIFVIIESFSLFFFFASANFFNKTINTIAESCFAVYVLHTSQPLLTYLWDIDNKWLVSYSYYRYIIQIVFLCIIVFVISVLYDKLRTWIFEKKLKGSYNHIDGYISQMLNKYNLNL